MRAVFVMFSGDLQAVFAADVDGLIGTWKLVSWQVIVDNEPPHNVFGSHPRGFLFLTRGAQHRLPRQDGFP